MKMHGFWNISDISTQNSHWQSDRMCKEFLLCLSHRELHHQSILGFKSRSLLSSIQGFWYWEFCHFPQEQIIKFICVLNEINHPPHMLIVQCVCQGRQSSSVSSGVMLCPTNAGGKKALLVYQVFSIDALKIFLFQLFCDS